MTQTCLLHLKASGHSPQQSPEVRSLRTARAPLFKFYYAEDLSHRRWLPQSSLLPLSYSTVHIPRLQVANGDSQ